MSNQPGDSTDDVMTTAVPVASASSQQQAGTNRRAMLFVYVMAAVGLLVTAGLITLGYRLIAGSMKFDAEAWRATESTPENGYFRQQMAQNLIFRGLLRGLTRPEIEKLLGPPSTAGYFRGYYDMIYYLGPDSSFGIDSEWLCIRFGPDGRAVKIDRAED